MQKSKFQTVVEILIKQGLNDEQITKFCEAIAREGFAHLMETAAEYFSKEDLKKVEECRTQEETDDMIKKIYKERVGKDPEVEMQMYIDKFAEGFLKEHANPSSDKPLDQPSSEDIPSS